MKTQFTHVLLWGLYVQMICLPITYGQHISFRPLTGNNSIMVNPGFPSDLVFERFYIDSEHTNTIDLDSQNAAWFKVEAPAHYDVTVYVDWETPPGVMQHLFDFEATIPFKLRFAYANQGETNIVEAKTNAVVIPEGYFSASFPVNRRLNGLPLPPPTPEFDGFNTPKETIWLFFFGEVGPISLGNKVATGSYIANLNINISFTSYE